MKFVTRCFVISLVALSLTSACSSTPTKKDEDATADETEQADSAPKTSAQELFVQGNKALDAKDFDNAIALYEQALERDDARWDIYMNKAIAHSAQQQFSPAIEAIDQALTHGGDTQPEVYFNLGNIYQNRGLYAQSIKAYRTSLALRDRPHVDTLINIAGALVLMRQFDQAKATYEKLEQLAPDDPRVYLGLGLVEQMKDHLEDALAYYEQAITMEPDFGQGWFNKAVLLTQMGRKDDALQSYQRYLDVAPDGPYADQASRRIAHLKSKK